MLFSVLLPSFNDELEKIAKSLGQKVEEHHQAEKKDWGAFEKNMRSPRFVAEVVRHPESDEKLKDYVRANNQYMRSKKVVANVPSSSSGKVHQVKRLPDGRMGCSCKDWQYKGSWSGADCKHIKALKGAGLDKKAAHPLSIIGRGAGLMNISNKVEKTKEKGREAKENVRRFYAGEPFHLPSMGH